AGVAQDCDIESPRHALRLGTTLDPGTTLRPRTARLAAHLGTSGLPPRAIQPLNHVSTTGPNMVLNSWKLFTLRLPLAASSHMRRHASPAAAVHTVATDALITEPAPGTNFTRLCAAALPVSWSS